MPKQIPKEAKPMHQMLSAISVGSGLLAVLIGVYYQIWLLVSPTVVVTWYFAKFSWGVEYV